MMWAREKGKRKTPWWQCRLKTFTSPSRYYAGNDGLETKTQLVQIHRLDFSAFQAQHVTTGGSCDD